MIKNKFTTFSKIIEVASNIEYLLNTLNQKHMYLKNTYEKLMLQNTTIDVITTDSFGFQNNIFEIKIENNKNLYKKIAQQIYGDYYKLIKYITQYVNNFINTAESYLLDETLINSTKLIENIEPYRMNNQNNSNIYNIKNSNKIYNYIVDILEILNKNYKKYDDKIQIDQKSLNVGINIENYINNMKSNNEDFKSKIELCSAFFYKYTEYHLKYLSSLELELKNLYKNTSSEINFNIINLDTNISDKDINITPGKDSSNNMINLPKKSRKYISLKYFINKIPKLTTVIKMNFIIIFIILFYKTNY